MRTALTVVLAFAMVSIAAVLSGCRSAAATAPAAPPEAAGHLAVHRAAQPVVVDGSLAEWGALDITSATPAEAKSPVHPYLGPQDISFKFSTRYDADYLYVAVSTLDNKAFVRPDRVAKRQDGVDVFADASEDPDGVFEPSATDANALAAKAGSKNKEVIYILLGTGPSPTSPATSNPEGIPAGTLCACVSRPDGLDVEVAIPTAFLDKMHKGPWRAVRLNIRARDLDGDNDKVNFLYWQPKWDATTQTWPDAGTFFKGA